MAPAALFLENVCRTWIYKMAIVVGRGEATKPAKEDEKNLSKVTMQFSMFEALLRGYLASAGDFITKAEKQHLVSSGQLTTFEQGIRSSRTICRAMPIKNSAAANTTSTVVEHSSNYSNQSNSGGKNGSAGAVHRATVLSLPSLDLLVQTSALLEC